MKGFWLLPKSCVAEKIRMYSERVTIPGTTQRLSWWQGPGIVFGIFGAASLYVARVTPPEEWQTVLWSCAPPLVFAVLLLWRALRDGPRRVLTDPFVMLVAAFTLYFLIGPLLLAIGPADEAAYVLQWYPARADEIVRVTGMNLVGLGALLLLASLFPSRLLKQITLRPISRLNSLPVRRVFWICVFVSVAAKLYVLPVDLNPDSGEIVHGIIRSVGGLAQFVILLGVLYRGKGQAVMRITAVVMAASDFLTGMVLFSKLAAIVPLVTLLVGLYLRGGKRYTLIIGASLIAVVLALLTTPVSVARLILATTTQSDVGTRLDILSEAISAQSSVPDSDAGTWARLCYAVPQAAAVELYETNRGGNDLELIGWVFLPRLLFPDKPIITRSGMEFNEKITGSRQSSTGTGLFISGYYNLGWSGIFLAAWIAAWILGTYAVISRSVIESGSTILLPIPLIASFAAFRIDGHFIADYLGLFGMLITPMAVLLLVLQIRGQGTRSKSPDEVTLYR